jgi:cytoskeletal protein CcmA (bactofilin family)
MADASDPGARATVIGPTIVIRGKLKSDEDLVIRGRIEAAISCSRQVNIEQDGVVKADIAADSVVVSGVVVGNLVAQSQIELNPEARVVGDISAPLVVMKDGARLRGKIDTQAVDEAMEAPFQERTEPQVTVPAAAAAAAARPAPATLPAPLGPVPMSAVARPQPQRATARKPDSVPPPSGQVAAGSAPVPVPLAYIVEPPPLSVIGEDQVIGEEDDPDMPEVEITEGPDPLALFTIDEALEEAERKS